MEVPRQNPSLKKQPSNPISIGGGRSTHGHAHGHAHNKGGQGGAPQLAHSCPPIRYEPPKAPSARPRVPSIEPPPMELPPSPPIFSDLDVRKELERQQMQGAKMNAMQMPALSRSLNDYSWANYAGSLPNFSLKQYQPSFGAVQEKPEPEEEEAKAPRAMSYNESSTIYSMLRESATPTPTTTSYATQSSLPRSGLMGSGGSMANTTQAMQAMSISSHGRPPLAPRVQPHSPPAVDNDQHMRNAEPDDLQFSISLTDEGGFMQEDEPSSTSNTKFSLTFQ